MVYSTFWLKKKAQGQILFCFPLLPKKKQNKKKKKKTELIK